MIPTLLLTAVALCQPAGPDAHLVAATRAWFSARRLADDRAPGVTPATLVALQRQAFSAWGRAARDPNFLRDGGRLAEVFHRGMDYAEVGDAGELRPWAGEAGVLVRVPLGYAPARAWPTLVAVFDAASESVDVAASRALDLVDADWVIVLVDAGRLTSFVRTPVVLRLAPLQSASLVGSALVWAVGPATLGASLWRLAFDSAVPEQAVDERDPPRGLFALLGGAQRRLYIDRDRLVLACSGRATQVGVRAAAMAPDRFAGLVLWTPEAAPAGLLDNLALVPSLVVAEGPVAGGPTAGAVAAQAALAQVPGSGVRLRAWPEERTEIAAWLRTQRRDLFRRRVAFVMEEDGIVDGFWLRIDAANFSNLRSERRAGIEAIADRGTNTITVTARHVDEFTLLLNDAIVDLDRPVVIEINGVKATLRRVRSIEFLLEAVFQRFDPGYLFTTAITLAVPRRG